MKCTDVHLWGALSFTCNGDWCIRIFLNAGWCGLEIKLNNWVTHKNGKESFLLFNFFLELPPPPPLKFVFKTKLRELPPPPLKLSLPIRLREAHFSRDVSGWVEIWHQNYIYSWWMQKFSEVLKAFCCNQLCCPPQKPLFATRRDQGKVDKKELWEDFFFASC